MKETGTRDGRNSDGQQNLQQQMMESPFHVFIFYTTVLGCVSFAIGMLYVHFFGRRKNRLPDQPHSSATARFWNELNNSPGASRPRNLGRQQDEAESLLARTGKGDDDSADSL